MDGQPVTRAELAEALAQQKRELKQEILEGVQELVRDSQTEILKAFLPHQEGMNLRLQEIEKRLLLNPPAT